MSYEDNPSDSTVEETDLIDLLNPELMHSVEPFSSADRSPASTFSAPISGKMQYRGWYGQSNGRSNWKPSSSRYGGRGGKHKGLDLFTHSLLPIQAVATGYAEYNDSRDPNGWGNFISQYFKQDGTTYVAIYAHLDPASKFEKVVKFTSGSQIGISGCSGNAGVNGNCHRNFLCDGYICIQDHLHFELLKLVKVDGKNKPIKIDPFEIFSWVIKFEDDNNNKLCSAEHLQYQSVMSPA